MPSNRKNKIIDAIKTVYDPEIPINIYEMGLIYNIEDNDGDIKILMSLTAPNCPEAERLPFMVKKAIKEYVEDAKSVEVEITFEPAWTPDRMSEEAKIAMEMLY